MLVIKRVWRTQDGRLVPDGHGDAAFLALVPGDQLTEHEARGVPRECLQGADEIEVEVKPASAATKPRRAARKRG